jgi:hypothetical protein
MQGEGWLKINVVQFLLNRVFKVGDIRPNVYPQGVFFIKPFGSRKAQFEIAFLV